MKKSLGTYSEHCPAYRKNGNTALSTVRWYPKNLKFFWKGKNCLGVRPSLFKKQSVLCELFHFEFSKLRRLFTFAISNGPKNHPVFCKDYFSVIFFLRVDSCQKIVVFWLRSKNVSIPRIFMDPQDVAYGSGFSWKSALTRPSPAGVKIGNDFFSHCRYQRGDPARVVFSRTLQAGGQAGGCRQLLHQSQFPLFC